MRVRSFEFRSAVGAWKLWLCAPPPDLMPAVTGLWATESETSAFREQVLPRESVELMINLGGPQTLIQPDGGHSEFRQGWVSGLQSGCLEIASPTPARLVAASLHPAHAGALLGLEGWECSNRVVRLDEILSTATRDLVERMHACDSVAGRFGELVRFLRIRLERARLPCAAACFSVNRILATGGQVSARDLQDDLRCSARYLEKSLAAHTGFTPKRLARLVRFSRAVDVIRTGPPPDWSAVAQACGFYDQAHFANEFRQFTGATPGEFLQRRDPSSQAMLVD